MNQFDQIQKQIIQDRLSLIESVVAIEKRNLDKENARYLGCLRVLHSLYVD